MNISTIAIKRTVVHILHRFHVVIFTILILGGLTLGIFALNSIIIQSGDSGEYTASTPATFDEATISKIEKLRTKDEPPAPLNLGNKRSNPFVE